MTQTQPHRIDVPVFLAAFVGGPLVVTALTFWIGGFSIVALVMGSPFYVAIGLPALIWHLRRADPTFTKIVGLALLSVLALFPVTLLLALLLRDDSWAEVAPIFLGFALVFAGLWSGTFALLYIRFRRDPERKI